MIIKLKKEKIYDSAVDRCLLYVQAYRLISNNPFILLAAAATTTTMAGC